MIYQILGAEMIKSTFNQPYSQPTSWIYVENHP